MSEWDYGRCKSLIEEVEQHAGRFVEVLQAHLRENLPVRAAIADVDGMFNALRKVKALLVRERKSRA